MHRYSMYIIKQSPLFVNIFWKLFLLLWLYFIYPLCYNQFAVFLLQLKGGVHNAFTYLFFTICRSKYSSLLYLQMVGQIVQDSQPIEKSPEEATSGDLFCTQCNIYLFCLSILYHMLSAISSICKKYF